jgi:hypothetical protein
MRLHGPTVIHYHSSVSLRKRDGKLRRTGGAIRDGASTHRRSANAFSLAV